KYWSATTCAAASGRDPRPSEETADAIYDAIAAGLRTPDCLPRALFERFNISVLATTDDPLDDLAPHATLAGDDSFNGRVIPTFRPDRFLEPANSGWPSRGAAPWERTRIDTSTCGGFSEALGDHRASVNERRPVYTDR